MISQHQQHIICRAKELLEVVWPNCQREHLADFYTSEVVGHYKDEVFGYKDIEDRLMSFSAETSSLNYKLLTYLFVQDILVFNVRQLWCSSRTGNMSEAIVTGAYRFLGDKVAEVWLMEDERFPGYRESTQNMEADCLNYDIAKTAVDRFWRLVHDHQEMFNAPKVDLTRRESDSMYYFLKGYSSKEAGLELGISARTVETYITKIKDKYDCSTRNELMRKVFP